MQLILTPNLRMRSGLLAFGILMFFLAPEARPSIRPLSDKIPVRSPTIRVLMAKDLDSVTLYGKDLRQIMHHQNEQKILNGNRGVRFQCKAKEPGQELLFASLQSPEGHIRYNSAEFSGRMHVWINNRGQCQLVNELGLEDYVETLLPAEMNKKWPVEVLKAQAVAARTYALYKMKKNNAQTIYDLENSEKDQVNGGMENLDHKTRLGREQTAGEILVGKDGKLGPIYYHATCGGRTLSSEPVWGFFPDHLISRPCPCGKRKDNKWESHITDERMLAFLNHHLKQRWSNSSLEIVDPGARFPFLTVSKGGRTYRIAKPALRKYFGRVDVASNNFTLEASARGYMLRGQGKGHGVGMCQIGALELGNSGMDYRKILAHYFPNHEIKKIY